MVTWGWFNICNRQPDCHAQWQCSGRPGTQRCLIFPVKFNFFFKNLHNSSFQFSLESVAASRESGVISRPGSSLFSCGVERQRSAASKIERCLLSLSFWHALLELRLVIWCWKRHHISYQEFWQAHYDYLFTVFYLPGRVCVDTKCGHHWCTFCERCIMCSGDLLFTCWPTKHFVIILDVLIWCFAPVWFFLAALLGRPVPVRGERGQAATTAVSLKTLSKLLFRLPVLQTR